MVRGEAGYNLVVLIVAVTVLNVLVAAMLPLWSTAIRREKEEELVFRGLQYAEAIRVFHQRFQRYPMKLEELIEVKPRCIRQLWKDPMTDDGKWVLIPQDQPGPPLQPQTPNETEGQPPAEGDANGRSPQFGPRKGETVTVGPIVGVHSRSGKKSMLVFFGHERYDEWAFTENIIPSGGQRQPFPQAPGSGNPNPNAFTYNFSTRWVGRPMRFSTQPPEVPQSGTMPDGSPSGPAKPKPPARPSSSNRP